MKLQDFAVFDPFNRLREKMGTDQFGYFELFDPERHLTGDERSSLAHTGVVVDLTRVGRLLDFTLVYKNSRVALIDGACYHLAHCDQIPQVASVTLATATRALGAGRSVCPGCLQQLAFLGYDEHKARKAGYNRSVLERFTLESFWRHYPPYPIKLGRELVKPLEHPLPAVTQASELAGVVAMRES
ncbi:MAG: hypothetical protein ACX931_17290 [Saccharospirillum sp.]